MFKKFDPKEDISSSTSLKSSVQRNIRSQLLVQLPFLSTPVWRDSSTLSTTAPVMTPNDQETEEEGKGKSSISTPDDEEIGKKGKGKNKGKGKGKEEKKGKGKLKEDDDEKEEDVGDMIVLDEIWPKKESLGLTKCHDRISIFTVNSTPLFVQHFDGPFIPTLKLLHRYPALLPHVQIDRGAIKFLLAGANMMAPGFLSPGGLLPDGLNQDQLVAIHAEGKEHACGIGKMTSSSEEVRKVGKGIAVEVITWIGDDLWKIDTIGL
ncbi:hypothetical protein TREMEDRAFT_44990 [Tremella mesenterica DSM 1558]|uniref:uncharacterized protein n=1 Tax=Tremella mesenterica (strain ATCC 24925 / CBS 8224 / DSM 1558 / NBRC 9311 / NRRL Y-6157 / RJB 2259-6 / UBC 559-6) TaxID=578456 RepID=UPI0003F49F7C|nr:uncharacterized protein TREMEDRAFT_44990 [Tremella mesenterica DSM 1558]EIW68019.1 hypothetical protein TREMEDRAFT_44990 [Tremella mesenterica DSM 1558]